MLQFLPNTNPLQSLWNAVVVISKLTFFHDIMVIQLDFIFCCVCDMCFSNFSVNFVTQFSNYLEIDNLHNNCFAIFCCISVIFIHRSSHLIHGSVISLWLSSQLLYIWWRFIVRFFCFTDGKEENSIKMTKTSPK